MPELQFNTYLKVKYKKPIPNAIETAKRFIEDNRHFFTEDAGIAFKIAIMLHSYANQCSDSPNTDLSIILDELKHLKNS